MNFNNTELDSKPLLNEYKAKPSWEDTLSASVKNFTSVGLSTSERNYYNDELSINIKDWIEKAPESKDVFKRISIMSPDALDNYENLYSKGKLDLISSDKSEIGGLTGGDAFLKYKELQKLHGFQSTNDIKASADSKAKNDFLTSLQTLNDSDYMSAKMIGTMGGVMHDPITLMTLPMGSFVTGGSIGINALRAFGQEALIETAAQGIIAPKVYAYKKELELKTSIAEEATQAVMSIATAGTFRAIGSATYDLTAKGIAQLKAKDPELAQEYTDLMKGNVTDNLTEHIDNMHKVEFGDGIDTIKNPNEDGIKLTESEAPTEIDKRLLEKVDSGLMYHGTDEVFETFDISKSGKTDEGFAGKGFYFTNVKEEAEYYTTKGIVKEVYLDMKKPLIVDEYDEINKLVGLSNERDRTGKVSAQITERLKEKGYDSVIIRDVDEQGNPVNEYVVFDNKQILKEKPKQKLEDDLKLTIGTDEQGQPLQRSYKELDLEIDTETKQMTDLFNCLRGV